MIFLRVKYCTFKIHTLKQYITICKVVDLIKIWCYDSDEDTECGILVYFKRIANVL
jgi:hypothetical protein